MLNKNILKNVNTSIDWNYLKEGKGARKVENVAQVIVGRLVFWVSLITVFGVILSEVMRGMYLERIINGESVSSIIFWSAVLLVMYSLFLLRNRERFLDKQRKRNLHKLRKILMKTDTSVNVEISDYLSFTSLWLIDYILNVRIDGYLEELFDKMMKLPKSVEIVNRLGLDFSKNFNFDLLFEQSEREEKLEYIERLLNDSFEFALENEFKYINEETLIYLFIRRHFAEDLKRFGVTEGDFEGIRLWMKNESVKNKYLEDWQSRISIKPKTTVNRAYTSRFTPLLNRYSRDFTMEVIKGNFKISIARENELNNAVNILEKGDKSAVLIVGEPGVGKTTLVRSLAVRMVVEDVPNKLQDMRLVGFDFNKAFSASKNVDSFKRKLSTVFEEVSQSRNVVLVLDNFNQLLNLRQDIIGEIANILVDSYDTYNIRIVATTDESQYERFVRPHRALAGIFTQVRMEIPSDEVATQIVMDEVPAIESEYGVRISYSAIKGSVQLSHKFAYDRVLPDKAIDILKETVVKHKDLAGKKPLEFDEVAQVISSKVGVKLGSISDDESIKLSKLEGRMHRRVIDQEDAIKAVCGALRRSRSGLTQEGKPTASFLFFGPTGVGKTEVAKTVSEVYYGNEDRMVRVDMSEYHEEENLKRLIGFTSQQGAFEGGFLTEPIHANPFSLLLLDEIDKANPKVLDLFLQVLDEGYLYDGIGRKIDFRNTIIIATSNAGSSVIADLLEKGEDYETVRKSAMEEVKKVFRIEFLNRFDKVIMFKPLGREEVKLVAKKFVEQVRLKLFEKGIKLTYGDELLERLASLGYNPVYGAREMRRVVQEEVENKVAEMIVRGEIRSGEEVKL